MAWISEKWKTFVDVFPEEDFKEHYLGDECWCKPNVEIVEGGDPSIMIAHNAADGRE